MTILEEGGGGNSSGSTALPQSTPRVSCRAITRGAETTQTRHRATRTPHTPSTALLPRPLRSPITRPRHVSGQSRPRTARIRRTQQQSGGQGRRRPPPMADRQPDASANCSQAALQPGGLGRIGPGRAKQCLDAQDRLVPTMGPTVSAPSLHLLKPVGSRSRADVRNLAVRTGQAKASAPVAPSPGRIRPHRLRAESRHTRPPTCRRRAVAPRRRRHRPAAMPHRWAVIMTGGRPSITTSADLAVLCTQACRSSAEAVDVPPPRIYLHAFWYS